MTRFSVRYAGRHCHVAVAMIVVGLSAAGGWSAWAAPPSVPEGVDMFAAIERGELDVKLIPKNANEARIVLTNKTKAPLTVRLPDAFAGVPAVRAQFGFGQNMGFGQNRGMVPGNGVANNNMNQAVGGPGKPNGRNGNNPPVRGFFNLPPEKSGDFKVATVCLEHGKKDPRTSVPYEILPIERVVASPAVRELCRMLSDDETDQRAAQAAVWHLANGLTWEQLAAKRIEHLNGPDERYFTEEQLRAAKELAEKATQRASDTAKTAAAKTPPVKSESAKTPPVKSPAAKSQTEPSQTAAR